jgi:hypothetical protein
LLLSNPAGAQDLGSLSIAPNFVEVDAEATFALVYTVGDDGLLPGDGVALFEPRFHGARWWWGGISIDPADCASGSGGIALVTAISNGGTAVLTVERNITSPTLHDLGLTTVLVDSGYVLPEDTITITVGDISDNADCGLKVGARAFRDVEW